MKSLNTIQKLSKIGKVLSKIAFIFSVIGFCGCIAGLFSLNFGNSSLIKSGGVTLHILIFDNEASIVLGIMFILGSLLCRYGAELKEHTEK